MLIRGCFSLLLTRLELKFLAKEVRRYANHSLLCCVHEISYSEHRGKEHKYVSQPMPTKKHKHVVLDQSKIKQAQKLLGTQTEKETIERALEEVIN